MQQTVGSSFISVLGFGIGKLEIWCSFGGRGRDWEKIGLKERSWFSLSHNTNLKSVDGRREAEVF
jgi:hypothetical protein